MSLRVRFVLRRATFELDVDLELPGQGITALFGPSGAGKTTILRAVAGLERIAGAELHVNGEFWQQGARFVPPHRRALGYVFQDTSLFAHRSVRGNLEYGWKRAGRPREVDFDATAALLGLETMLDRAPHTLSGGEQQRVAIARALLSAPRLLLFDEPLAALDAARKREILPYLERVHAQLAIPALYVSHSAEEVARLADHLVLLDRGRVLAQGAPQALFARLDLADAFADDPAALIEAQVVDHDPADQLTRLEFAGGDLFVPQRAETPGTRLRCRIHARDVSLALERPAHSSILNLIAVRVVNARAAAHPAQLLVQLDAGGVLLIARITRRSWNVLQLASGMNLWAQIKAAALLD